MPESNEGARLALAKQVATSVSVMMPCPWTSNFVNYLNAKPILDDIHILSYDWVFPSELKPTDVNLRNFKTEKFKTLLGSLKPG